MIRSSRGVRHFARGWNLAIPCVLLALACSSSGGNGGSGNPRGVGGSAGNSTGGATNAGGAANTGGTAGSFSTGPAEGYFMASSHCTSPTAAHCNGACLDPGESEGNCRFVGDYGRSPIDGDATHLYSAAFSPVLKYDIETWTETAFATAEQPPRFVDVSVAGTQVFTYSSHNAPLLAYDTTTGVESVVVDTVNEIAALQLVGGKLYFQEQMNHGGAIVSVDATGGTPTLLVAPTGATYNSIQSLHVDETYLYYQLEGIGSEDPLMRAPLADPTQATVILPNTWAAPLLGNTTHLFWVNSTQLMAMSKSGEEPVGVYERAPDSVLKLLAVEGEYAYFIETYAGTAGDFLDRLLRVNGSGKAELLAHVDARDVALVGSRLFVSSILEGIFELQLD